MQISIAHEGSIAIATVTGDITHAVAADFQQRLLPELGARRALIIDCARIEMMTSAGLRALLLLHREATQRGHALILAAVPDGVRDVMAVTGFWDQFLRYPTLAEAAAAVGGTAA